ncbi:MAG: PQQ-binding-like beta-propeller repeat protein [Treponemataceae bacterium]
MKNPPIRGIFALVIFYVLVSVSCERSPVSTKPMTPAVIETKLEEPVSDIPNPAAFSYQAILGDALLSNPSSNEPDMISLTDPFPQTVLVDEKGIEVAGQTIGRVGEGQTYDVAAWGEARRGDYRYRITGGSVLIAEQVLPKKSETSEEPKALELWRYRSPSGVVAGPIAFDDRILIATDKPSFIAVDRKTGTIAFERDLLTLPRGPLFFLGGLSRVAAFDADGTLSMYNTASKVNADPIEAFLKPSEAAFPLIEKRIKDRLGKRDERPVILFQPFGPRDEIPSEGVVLFRMDFTKDQRSRLFVDGAASRPFLVEIFSSSGEVLSSNIEYSVEAVLEFGFESGKTYFIAVALLSENSENNAAVPAARPRLVIAAK